MRKLFLLCLLLIVLINTGVAQTKDSAKFAFTLQQAIDYAVKNQYSMKNATLDEAIANDAVGEARAIGLPQINGSIQYTDNDPLRRMFLTTGNPLFAPYFPKGTPANEVVAIPNVFQLPVGIDASATISQMIFNSSFFIGMKAAKTFRELSSKTTEMTKIQVIENVSKAYYMVLVNKERLILFEKNVNSIDSLLAHTKAMNQQGIVEKVDVSRLMVTYNTILSARDNFKNLLDLGVVLLKYQMSMSLANELTLTQKIDDFKVDPLDETKPLQMDYGNRIEYSILQTEKRMNELELKNNKFTAMPNLSAFANVGEFTQNDKTQDLTNPNLFYNYGLFGVTMNVPIFSGFQKSYRIQHSTLKTQKTQNDLSNLELSIDVQVKSAIIMLKNDLNTLEAQNKNMGLAGEVAKVTKIKYNEGVGTSLEVNTAESALVDSQKNYFNALYDALVAKVDYLKAVGKLH